MGVTNKALFSALRLQLFNKYVNFASVAAVQAHNSYMWDVESRKSQVKTTTKNGLGSSCNKKSIVNKGGVCLNVLGVAVVGQQSVWGADWHWEAVPQSSLHSQNLHQVWEILCGTAGHDQRKGWCEGRQWNHTVADARMWLWSFLNKEFFDEWAIKLGEQEPYKGPKTPDGRVS